LLIGISIPSTTILNSWAIHENQYVPTQEIPTIPDWIKKNAAWWANGEITENDFLLAITFLIDNGIIKIADAEWDEYKDNVDYTKQVPDWIKNNARWWANGQIPDSAFVSGLEWLISKGILKVDAKIISFLPIEDVRFADMLRHNDKTDFVHLHSALFETYVHPEAYVMEDGVQKWTSPMLGLNPNKMNEYNEVAIWHDPQKAAVIFPLFTSTAYAPGGFYDYYRGDCEHCTTTTMKDPTLLFTSSGNAVQALTLLGYDLLNDIDVDKNPDILKNYDKIILVHNEYVTRNQFDAITSHPKVIYLYPNALYAEIEVDYEANTITLIRGHNYPPEDPVSNGFDWEFDNTHPYEYDTECKSLQMYPINEPRSGGNTHWMTTCYPELPFYNSYNVAKALLQAIKDL